LKFPKDFICRNCKSFGFSCRSSLRISSAEVLDLAAGVPQGFHLQKSQKFRLSCRLHFGRSWKLFELKIKLLALEVQSDLAIQESRHFVPHREVSRINGICINAPGEGEKDGSADAAGANIATQDSSITGRAYARQKEGMATGFSNAAPASTPKKALLPTHPEDDSSRHRISRWFPEDSGNGRLIRKGENIEQTSPFPDAPRYGLLEARTSLT
jgi:hypothetical protein